MKPIKKIALNHAKNVGLVLVSVIFMMPRSARALDPLEASSAVLASEGGKLALIEAVRFFRSKPGLAIATGIVCGSCLPLAGTPAVGVVNGIACGLLLGRLLD